MTAIDRKDAFLVLRLQNLDSEYFSETLHPYFPSIVENVTVSHGRKAVLKCEVDNLRNYKVSFDLQNHLDLTRIFLEGYEIEKLLPFFVKD